MKKILLLGLLFSGLVLPKYAHADSAISPQNGRFIIDRDKNDTADATRRWSKPSLGIAEEVAATAPVFISSAAGIVVAVCVTSGAAGGYAIIFDTAIVDTASINTAVKRGANIHRQATNPLSSPSQVANAGCSDFPDGLPFSTGLVIVNSASDIRTYLRYRILRQ